MDGFAFLRRIFSLGAGFGLGAIVKMEMMWWNKKGGEREDVICDKNENKGAYFYYGVQKKYKNIKI